MNTVVMDKKPSVATILVCYLLNWEATFSTQGIRLSAVMLIDHSPQPFSDYADMERLLHVGSVESLHHNLFGGSAGISAYYC